MRYHKAIKVSRPEADFIIQKGISPSLNDHVVISHLDTWYDVRALTDKEVGENSSRICCAQRWQM